MSYSYTTGDGLTVLDPATPAGSAPVAEGDDAIRQIKAYMRDTSTAGLAGLVTRVATLEASVAALTGATVEKFQAGSNSHKTIVAGSGEVKIDFAVEVLDIGSCYNPATSKFIAPQNGVFFFHTSIRYDNVSAISPSGMGITITIKRNGSPTRLAEFTIDDNTDGTTLPCSALLNLSTGDEIEVFSTINIAAGSATWQATGDSQKTIFQGFRII